MIKSNAMPPAKECVLRAISRQLDLEGTREKFIQRGMTFKQRLAFELNLNKTIVCAKFWA